MSEKSKQPKKSTAQPAAEPPAVGRRSMYVSAPETVLTEIDTLIAADPLSRGRFLGRLLELGLDAYKREKGLTS